MLRLFSTAAFILVFSVISISAQQLRPTVTVNRAFGKAMSYEKLVNPKKFEDLIAYYPGSWIEGYQETTVTILSDGKTKSVTGKDNSLTADQINLLKSAAIGDQLILQINYYSLNSVTNKKQNEELNLKYTIVADQEASPVNGEEALTSYFEEQAFKKLEIKSGAPFIGATIAFKVTESGMITTASLKQSSGNKEADQLLIQTLNKMTAWKPAQNKNGKKFVQEFVLQVVNAGC